MNAEHGNLKGLSIVAINGPKFLRVNSPLCRLMNALLIYKRSPAYFCLVAVIIAFFFFSFILQSWPSCCTMLSLLIGLHHFKSFQFVGEPNSLQKVCWFAVKELSVDTRLLKDRTPGPLPSLNRDLFGVVVHSLTTNGFSQVAFNPLFLNHQIFQWHTSISVNDV